MIILRTEKKIRRDSNKRPKSLILSIPANMRDILEFEHGTEVILTVCSNKNDELQLVVQKKK
jgi:hypothetical protein